AARAARGGLRRDLPPRPGGDRAGPGGAHGGPPPLAGAGDDHPQGVRPGRLLLRGRAAVGRGRRRTRAPTAAGAAASAGAGAAPADVRQDGVKRQEDRSGVLKKVEVESVRLNRWPSEITPHYPVGGNRKVRCSLVRKRFAEAGPAEAFRPIIPL